MPNTELSRGTLFPPELVTDLIDKTQGKSVLAALSAQRPIMFNGQREFIFSMDSEIDVVAENGAKSHGGIDLTPVNIVPIKVEYGARISDEFMYGSEEEKIDVLKNFNEGFAKKLAKGIDLMAIHGINPRSNTASAVIGTNNFDSAVNQRVTYTAADPDTNIEDAIAIVKGSEMDVTGLALSEIARSDLSKLKDLSGRKVYPELTWGNEVGAMNGLPTAAATNVSHGGKIRAIVGDFETCFKWGIAKNIPMEIIQYGDPDNSGKDLKGYNQVYVRCEAYVGWGILVPEAFAIIDTDTH
jgi:HK97 family phage major capsid protein